MFIGEVGKIVIFANIYTFVYLIHKAKNNIQGQLYPYKQSSRNQTNVE